MRIIAGKYRSRKLETLPGLKTRPTLDKTKEAIFSSLGSYLNGYTILDIFGGSGALSLESISRGASKAYIIDNNSEAIEIIKKNAKNLNIQNELIIYHNNYEQVLPTFIGKTKFDVIFIDPPFRLKVIDTIIDFIVKHDLLEDGGYIMAEYPVEDIIRKDYDHLQIKLCKRYSSSEILILEKEEICE